MSMLSSIPFSLQTILLQVPGNRIGFQQAGFCLFGAVYFIFRHP